jgi:hypothetical protein
VWDELYPAEQARIMRLLIERINIALHVEAEHRAAVDAAHNAIERASACGRLLIQAKARVGHGQWLAWVADHLSFRDRHARPLGIWDQNNVLDVLVQSPGLEFETRTELEVLNGANLLLVGQES